MSVKDPRSIMYVKRKLYDDEECLIGLMFEEQCDFDEDKIKRNIEQIRTYKAACRAVLAISPFKLPYLLVFKGSAEAKKELERCKKALDYVKRDEKQISEDMYALHLRFD